LEKGESKLEKKAVSGIMPALLLISLLPLALNIQPVKASGTIHIRADGSIDPPTAPISTIDNVTYTFTNNINDFLVIERSSIVVDGAGHTLRGNGSGRGIDLVSFGYLSNITIRNMEIREFDYAIYLEWCWNINISRNNILIDTLGWGVWLQWSWDNTIAGNNLTSEWGGVAIDLNTSPYNTLAENYISGNEQGIRLNNSLNCKIVRNNIDTNGHGIELTDSSDNNILGGNNVTFCNVGINLSTSSNNTLAENNITLSNEAGIILRGSSNNSLTENNIIGRASFSQRGIWLNSSSNNNSLTGNAMTNNKYGISLTSSSHNTLSGNNATENWHSGIYIQETSNYNNIFGNNVSANWHGIYIEETSNYNNLVGNTATNNWYGIHLGNSSNNILAENDIRVNDYSIELFGSSDNLFYHNNFVNAIAHAVIYNSTCVWDDGYPSGGNYWSDYYGVDFYHGPNQNLTGCDGVGDTLYIIDANNTDHYPLMKPYPQSPDVAAVNTTLSKTIVGVGYPVLINVTVENQGYFTETFNITFYAQWEPPSILIGTMTVSNLSIGETRTTTYKWNTTGFAKGIYTIIAAADTVPRETDIDDNSFTDGIIKVTWVGDFDGDFDVDYDDILYFVTAYIEYWSGQGKDSACDFDGDCDIDYDDILIFVSAYINYWTP